MRWQIPTFVLLWLIALYVCAKIDPTAVQLYITLTIFVIIARNLGTRREGLSAYSVFNRGCTPLLGQLQPDQFENEIRHRPLETDNNQNQQHSSRSTITASSQLDDHDSLLESMRAEIRRDARRAQRTFETTGNQSFRRRHHL